MTVEDVVIELSCMFMNVAGTLIETEVTGRDNAICTDVWAGSGTYGATVSNWLL